MTTPFDHEGLGELRRALGALESRAPEAPELGPSPARGPRSRKPFLIAAGAAAVTLAALLPLSLWLRGGGDPAVEPTTVAESSTTTATDTTVPPTTTTSSLATTSTTSEEVGVVSAESYPPHEPSSEPMPYAEVVVEPVTQAEIEAGLGDLVRDLAAADPEHAWPSGGIVVVGRVSGVLLFTTFFQEEGMCVHGFDGAHHTMVCGGADGSWTRPLGLITADPALTSDAAAAVETLGDFMLVITYSHQPWVALETAGGDRAQVTVGYLSAFPVAVPEVPETVRVFGPEDSPEMVDWEITINGTTEPALPPDLAFPEATASITAWEFTDPPHEGGCQIPVPHGALPCAGEVWRRVTFADPDLTISFPAFWQAGVDATGVRLSSAVAADNPPTVQGCSLGGVPLLTAGAEDVVLHVEFLGDASGLEPRPEDFNSVPNEILEWVPSPPCAGALIGYYLTFADNGTGVRVMRIIGEEGPPYMVEDILNTLTVGAPAPAGDQLMMACGQVVVPYAETPPAAAPLSAQAEEALAVLEGMGEGAWFADNYEWGLLEQSESELVLLGEARPGAGLEENPFVSAVFAKSPEGGWQPQGGWGQCHWWAEMAGWGPAEWVLDPAYSLGGNTTTLHLLATERACANGEAPEGRKVTTVLRETNSSLTVIVLVEQVPGYATCPSNPPFAVTVDLGHPLGDPALLDGATIPAQVRNSGP